MNEPHLRINTESLLSDYEFSFQVDSNGDADFSVLCHRNGISAALSKTKSIWDRRPHKPRELFKPLQKSDTAEKERQVIIEEAHEMSLWLRLASSHLFSIGSPVNDVLAECKLVQFMVAKEVISQLQLDIRIAIPQTTISNRKGFFSSLFGNHATLAIKPISSDGLSLDEGVELPFLTQRVKTADVQSQPEDAFSAAPTFIQPYIDKQYELRITVVGLSVFACKIDSTKMKDDEGGVDWRAGYETGIPQSIIEVPDGLQQFCLKYLSSMTIYFGCFDFIVDKLGVYWFLECNPNGQWMWLEEDLGFPISKAIADCLSAAKQV